ncbi:similar to Saccharomyces cerevisiae YIL118W RHO3 Non-essential small GTPase of the Rho/Rac subfamily of Ras-like proteins involved in the establishment of cell polarity [Maudiozyma barnettii]|uniref:GTP-binding protein RHO3 n=1 Tax=Maudiozyma barnettii TaxID=61262 RepID=A0A8H2VCU6_9SACH|nr:Rho family GTPase RHO3 [Kazachstania barnettii]CAB4252878.1 similar to Saccharomyces cerevisiae YIL118W RHO3 Non-essential small GTPase of the Rho/Rac subfamily of Ras-like proteins involved in the establishment of cell polarity [Kazachstania barnettii]CAD1780673.1 similar to Saccharomyces cerevisiae YIL118W RHO3 Non-essential small GTPase of the Rho/Rac subfamily of Ras-like proteins involved in the establishment of cell polarity [Kazachstania barnettii]
MGFLCGSNTESKKAIERKIVILGDGACGKTSLLNVFTRGYFPEVYEPTVFENYIHDIFVDNKHITLSLWDTAGQEEFDRLRSLSYSDTQCIMLCFSIDSQDSLENVKNKWVGEIANNCEGVKLVLVALKCDLRNSEHDNNVINPNNIGDQENTTNGRSRNGNKDLVTYEEGLAMAKQIGALRYLECSAKSNKGVNEAFTEAARVALTSGPAAGSAGGNSKDDDSDDDDSICTIM